MNLRETQHVNVDCITVAQDNGNFKSLVNTGDEYSFYIRPQILLTDNVDLKIVPT